ncbi:MAG TPA: DUF2505 domain-containing protein [Nocardioides sp.]|uniref:DUF2505 domain-containing protein n=1 Tax=uncultured Nocardioides sp. TaxID=198441 RepID=UPI002618D857|nr:DUF2505 domain-containing protein [uncultured Nocardioides sp.]HRD60091.1 DUF2505 domain-containing protein [Nocardioides sp.]HRI94512.1 DUF2505 domain-containing protein [Nocardioides sp.]HRK45558.1 DUF2505 domain-containing protein [Nocardioides sp.]
MATKLTYELTYQAPLTDVGEMLMEPSFREAVCAAQGALRTDVSVGPGGSGMKVVVDQVQASAGMPGFAKKFVGDEINLIQTELWSDLENAEVEVEIPGKPGQMAGTITLHEADGTTTETVSMEIKVGIPLVGGKIEGLIADLLRKALQKENEVGRTHLAG